MPAIFDKLLRIGEGKILRQLETISKAVNAIEDDFIKMTDEELQGMTVEFRERLAKGETLDDLMPEAFATVREAAKRVIGQRHFDVQVMGGAAMHLGNIAEMKTGEGKTLVSTLPAYLNALAGKGVHVVTVNDYLAKYHAEWMGRIHNFLGLTTGVILPSMRPDARREAYDKDITYGTNNELGSTTCATTWPARSRSASSAATSSPSSTRSTRSSSTRPGPRSSSAARPRTR